MDVPRDDATFLALLRKVVTLLDVPTPPDPAEKCGLCNYRKDYKEAGILERETRLSQWSLTNQEYCVVPNRQRR